jgi:hypothetical protein
MKVSWQVTGIRQDPWAEEHRIQVEPEKLPKDKGKYLNPELYGQPEEMAVHYLAQPDRHSAIDHINDQLLSSEDGCNP